MQGDFIHSTRYIIDEFTKNERFKDGIFTFVDSDGHRAVPFLRQLPKAPGKCHCFNLFGFIISF